MHFSEGLMDGIEHPYDSLKETAEAGAYAVEKDVLFTSLNTKEKHDE